MAIAYSIIFYRNVTDLPSGAIFHRPSGALLLPSATRPDLLINIAMSAIIYLALAVIIWRLELNPILYLLMAGFGVYHISRIVKNHGMAKGSEYKMSQVSILSMAYFATFGSELTAISILPIYFYETFDLSIAEAGEGAVFASVPLIKKSLTGQISGMVGSFGNIGAVFYLSLYTLTSAQTVFYTLGAMAVLTGLIAYFFFKEPGDMTELMPDGTVITIKI